MFYSLKSKFVFSFLLLEIIILSIIIGLNFKSLDITSTELIHQKNEISSKLFSEIIKVPLIISDIASIEESVHNFLNLENVIAVAIENTSGITLSSYVKESSLTKKQFQTLCKNATDTQLTDKYIFKSIDIKIDSQHIGKAHFVYSIQNTMYNIQQNKNTTYTLALLALFIGFILSYILANWLSKSLKKLTSISKNVSNQVAVDIPYTNSPKNEVETLFLEMHKMQKNIANYTNNLEQFIKALNSSAIVSKTDKNGIIIDVNTKFCDITCFKRSEIIGNTHNIIKDPQNEASFYKDMWNTLTSKKIYNRVFKNLNKYGNPYYVDGTITPLLDDHGNIKEYIAISFEVTEIVDAKNRAEEAKKIKEQFLSNMSHEIRTPLNAIIGFIKLLKKRLKDEQNIKYIDTIQSSSTSLLHIINDILDVSKIESNKLIIDKHSFNPEIEFKSTVETFDFKAKEKSISLSLNLDSHLPKLLYGDLLRVKQIVFNLLSNALKFTDENKNINVNVVYDNKLSKLNISVQDEGIGLTLEEQSKIFRSFEQADNSTTRKFGGTGLGLTISLSLAKLMDGEMTLVSKKGQGSTFTLSLPMEISTKHIDNEETSEDEEITFKGNVLVAEDNKTNQMLIKILLSEYELIPKMANDGLEAVEAFKNGEFDLVLMDENMPNMTGLEALKEIFRYENKNSLKHTPVVALTANVLQEDKKRFLDAGMDDFLAKPIDNDELERVLKKYLELS